LIVNGLIIFKFDIFTKDTNWLKAAKYKYYCTTKPYYWANFMAQKQA